VYICARLCAVCSLALREEGGEIELLYGEYLSLGVVGCSWRAGLFLTEGEIGVLSVCSLFFDASGSVHGCMCVYTRTHTLHVGYSM